VPGARCLSLQDTATTVAIDGSVFEHYPRYSTMQHEALTMLLGPEAAALVKLSLAKDGSGVGAALIAALAS
jgi:hexokinase